MALTPEKTVKNKVVKLLKDHGAYYFFPASYGMGRSGVPDVVCCSHGKFIGIECKAGDNKATALQLKELAAIREAEGVTFIINEENVGVLDEYLKNNGNADDRLRDVLR